MRTPAAPPFTFAVIADSHFHPEVAPGEPLTEAGWASDAHFNDRNRRARAWLEAAAPDFAIHLGDVTHPLPGRPAYEAALDAAIRVYAELPMPIRFVPGNHDVGDKPHPWAPAPSADEAKHAAFRRLSGRDWQGFVHGGCRFLLVDTPVLGSGLPLEAEQWAWLEAEVAAAAADGQRVFAFLHYPPFLLDRGEPEHYDNLAPPVRERLLGLLSRAEAIFCGHVHNFFWSDLGGRDLYVAPSTAFVRPEYSELGRIAPGDEFGRDDAEKLGIFLVHVRESGHSVEPVRTAGPPPEHPALIPGGAEVPPSPLAVTLRHAWDLVLDVPAAGLDPFRRKRARNDLVIQALWEAGLARLRLPLEDLLRPDTRARLAALRRHRARASFFTAEILSESTLRAIEEHRDLVEAIELILPRAWLDRPLPPAAAPLWLSAVGRADSGDKARFSHFAAAGFEPGDPALAALPAGAAGAVVRVPPSVRPWDGVAAALASPCPARVEIALPDAGESAIFDDDAAIAARVVEAALAAAHFRASVALDGFVDQDRAYFPRHGLLDRRGNPRPALRALASLGRLLAGGGEIAPAVGETGAFDVAGVGRIALPDGEQALPAGIELVGGRRVEAGRSAWPRLLL